MKQITIILCSILITFILTYLYFSDVQRNEQDNFREVIELQDMSYQEDLNSLEIKIQYRDSILMKKYGFNISLK